MYGKQLVRKFDYYLWMSSTIFVPVEMMMRLEEKITLFAAACFFTFPACNL